MRLLRLFTARLFSLRALLAPLLLFVLFALSSPNNPSAQSFEPTPVQGSAFARTQTRLYILGGSNLLDSSISAPVVQFMYLDLSVFWNNDAPAWTNLASGPKGIRIAPAAFSSDEQTFFVFHVPNSNSPWQYDVKTDSWTPSKAVFRDSTIDGIGAVTDPRTGLIYFAGGYNNDSMAGGNFMSMDIFDPVTQTINNTQILTPNRDFLRRLYYGNVWSKYRQSAIYWGGNNYDPDLTNANELSELKIDSKGWLSWSVLPVSFGKPEMRADHCMAINDDGTKVVVYGGMLKNRTITGELFILDLQTSSWFVARPGPPRSYAACAIAGGQFLLWGGASPATPLPPDTKKVFIFSLDTGSWSTSYTPPASYINAPPPPTLTRTEALWPTPYNSTRNTSTTRSPFPTSTPTPTPTPIAAIVGGAVGGVALLVAISGAAFIRQRRGRQHWRGGRASRGGSFRGDQDESTSLARGGIRKSHHSLDDSDQNGSTGESDLERTLQDIHAQHEALEMRRKLLLQQHQAENPRTPTAQRRGPTAVVDVAAAEYLPLQDFPQHRQQYQQHQHEQLEQQERWSGQPQNHRQNPSSPQSISSSTGKASTDRRTVQAITSDVIALHAEEK